MNRETNVAGLGEGLAEALYAPDSEVGRSFAALAENLGSLRRSTGSVVVTGPESGVGRTTVCLGLGAALTAAGKTVAVVDCNLDRPRLHRWFSRPNFTGLTSALEGDGSLDDYGFDAAPNLRIIPTGPVLSGPWGLAGSPKFAGAVRSLQGDRDVVLLDAPVAGEVLAARTLWGSFDGVLLVVHATRTPKGVARRFTDALLDARMELLGVVLNGYA
jgi:Mrp family chromosome partitioning ATPase